MRKRFLAGTDVATEVIPNYLRELADAVENNDIAINSIDDCKRASSSDPVEREHRITYSTTEEDIDLFNTRLIKLRDEYEEDGGDE